MRSNAGKATFTIDRSKEAMKAPRAVTKKTVAPERDWVPNSAELGFWHWVASWNAA